MVLYFDGMALAASEMAKRWAMAEASLEELREFLAPKIHGTLDSALLLLYENRT